MHMTIYEAIAYLDKMTNKNHDFDLFKKCVDTLRNKPKMLIKYYQFLSLYAPRINSTAIYNLLHTNFDDDKDKIKQLQVASALSFSSESTYIDKIIPPNRSIVFEIPNDKYDSYSMLIDHLPKNYKYHICKLNKDNKILIAIYHV